MPAEKALLIAVLVLLAGSTAAVQPEQSHNLSEIHPMDELVADFNVSRQDIFNVSELRMFNGLQIDGNIVQDSGNVNILEWDTATDEWNFTGNNVTGLNQLRFIDDKIEVGDNAKSDKKSSIAIGDSASAPNKRQLAIGDKASAGNNDAIAIGYAATSGGYEGTVIGTEASSSGRNAVIIGNDANVSGKDSVSIGHMAGTFDRRAVAIGKSAAADLNAVVIGKSASGDSPGVIVLGHNAEASTNFQAISIGRNSQASGQDSVSIGESSQNSKDYSIALGAESSADGKAAIALGVNASAPGSYEATFGNLQGGAIDVNITGNLTVHGTGGLDMKGNQIKNIPSPSAPGDAVNKSYVDSSDDTVSDDQNLNEVLVQGNGTGGVDIDLEGAELVDSTGTATIGGGNVEIPDGRLDINNPAASDAELNIGGSGFDPDANTDGALLLDGSYGGGLIFQDDDYAGIWTTGFGDTLNFDTNGSASGVQTSDGPNLQLRANGNLDIPNGNLQVKSPTNSDGSLNVEGDLEFGHKGNIVFNTNNSKGFTGHHADLRFNDVTGNVKDFTIRYDPKAKGLTQFIVGTTDTVRLQEDSDVVIPNGNVDVQGHPVHTGRRYVKHMASTSGVEVFKLGEMQDNNFRAKLTIAGGHDYGGHTVSSQEVYIWKRGHNAGAQTIWRGSTTEPVDVILTETTNDANGDGSNDTYLYLRCADYCNAKVRMGWDVSSFTEDFKSGLSDSDIVGDFVHNSSTEFAFRTTNGGNLSMNGNSINNVNILNANTKNFVQSVNSSHEVVYTSQESADARAVIEGSATVENGSATVELPRHFSQVVSDTQPELNVQLTPVGKEAMPVGVRQKSQDGFRVEQLIGEPSTFSLDYRVTGVRSGYESKQVLRRK